MAIRNEQQVPAMLTRPGTSRILALGMALVLAILLAPSPSRAAISATTYPFTASTGTALEPMATGTTQLSLPATVNTSRIEPIGFDFWLDGWMYREFTVSASGGIHLGSSSNASRNAQLLPYGETIYTGTNGEIVYKVVGTEPERRLVVEFRNLIPPSAYDVPGSITYQVWLSEGSGRIDFVYGTTIPVNTTSNGFKVGITRTTESCYITALPSTVVYTGTSPANLFASIAAGQQYTWLPRSGALAPALAPTGVVVTNGGSMASPSQTVSWTNNGGAAQTRSAVYLSSDEGATWDLLTVRTSAPATDSVTFGASGGLGSGQPYHWRVVALNEGAAVASADAILATPAGTFPTSILVGPGETYTRLTDAFAAIASLGLQGPTEIGLKDGYAPSSETYPLNMPRIGTRSCPITIHPDEAGTQAVFTFSGTLNSQGLLKFDRSKHVRLVGRRTTDPQRTRRIQVVNSSTSNGSPTSAVVITNDSTDVLLEGVDAKGSTRAFAYTSGVITVGGGTGFLGDDRLVIRDCAVGPAGATLPFSCFLVTSQTPNTYDGSNQVLHDDLKLLDSTIYNFDSEAGGWTGAGVYTLGVASIELDGNRFYHSVTPTTITGASFVAALLVQDTNGTTLNGSSVKVTGNRFGWANDLDTPTGTTILGGGPTTSNSTGYDAIYISAPAAAVDVTGNIFGAIDVTTGGIGRLRAVEVAAAEGTIGNNVVGLTPDGSAAAMMTMHATSSGSGSALGIHATFSQWSDIIDNSVQNFDLQGPLGRDIGFDGISASGVGGGGNLSRNLVTNIASDSSYTANGILDGYNTHHLVEDNTVEGMNIAGTNSFVRGIYLDGKKTARGNLVRNITTHHSNGSLIGMTINSTAQVSENTIYNLTDQSPTSGVVIGIYLASGGSGNSLISRNWIHSLGSTPGAGTSTIAGFFLANPLTGPYHIENNKVRLGLDASGASLTDGYPSFYAIADGEDDELDLRLYHNTFFIGGTGVGTGGGCSAMYSRSTVFSPIAGDIRNNVFVNVRSNAAGTGSHAIYRDKYSMTVFPTTAVTNNNVLRVTGVGGTFYQRSSSAIATLPGLQAKGRELNSCTADPNLVDPTGPAGTYATASILDPNPVAALPQEMLGDPSVTVAVDFTGQDRSALTPSDAGATAGLFTPFDVTPPWITFTPLPDTDQATTTRTLAVTITEYQTGLPAGPNQPVLYVRRGGAGAFTPIAPTSISGSGIYTALFDIDQPALGVLANDTVEYFAAAQDVAGMGASCPTGLTNANPPGSPSPAIPPYTPSRYRVAGPPMAGDYLVGGAGSPDYTGLTLALEDVRLRGVSAPVRLLLQPGYASSGESFPLSLSASVFGPSVDGTNTLTLRPAPGATGLAITAPAVAAASDVLRVTNISGFILDGSNTVGGTSRDLTLQNDATTGAQRCLFIANTGAPISGTRVRNCVLVAGGVAGEALLMAYSDASSSGFFVNTEIHNNDLRRAGFGIDFKGRAPTTDVLTIMDNVATSSGVDAVSRAIAVSYSSHLIVSRNTIGNVSRGDAWGVYGIRINNNGTDSQVLNNTIDGLTNTTLADNDILGLYSSGGTNLVQGNIVRNVSLNTSSFGYSGLRLVGCSNLTASGNTVRSLSVVSGSTGAPTGLSVQNSQSSLVTDNVISTINGSTAPFGGVGAQGMSLGQLRGSTTVTRNSISTVTNSNPAVSCGVSIYSAQDNLSFDRNDIRSVTYGGVSGYGGQGISLYACPGTVTISNCTIGGMGGRGEVLAPSTYTRTLAGIIASGTSPALRIYNNSIFMAGSILNSSNAAAAGLAVGTGSVVDFRNNIVRVTVGRVTTFGDGAVGVYLDGSSAQLAASSGNNLYSINPTGSLPLEAVGRIGTGTPSTTVAAWRTLLGTGAETNSLGGAASSAPSPSFASESTTTWNLAINCTSPAVGAGTDLSALGVVSDFNGEARPAVGPDVGADEIPQEGAPASPATDLLATGVACPNATISWSPPSPPPTGGYVVIRVQGSTPPSRTPNDFGTGLSAGTGTEVFRGTATSFADALPDGGNYTYAIYPWNNGSGCQRYRRTSPLTATIATAPLPLAQPTGLNASTTSAAVSLSWLDASPVPDGYLLLGQVGTIPVALPSDGVDYVPGQTIGAATVLSMGTALAANHTALLPGIPYGYALFSYQGSGVCRRYLTAAPLTSTFTTMPAPTSTLTCLDPDPTSGTITVVATLSTIATDFAFDDVTLVNAALSGFNGSGDTYSWTLTPSAQGTFGCQVPGGRFTDAEGTANTSPSNQVTRSFDSLPPTGTMSALTDPTRVGTSIPLAYTVGDASPTTSTLWVRLPGLSTWTDTGLVAAGTAGSFPWTTTTGLNGTYDFACRSIDAAGNLEAEPTTPEITLLLNTVPNGAFTQQLDQPDQALTFPMTDDLDVLITLTGASPGGSLNVARFVPPSLIPADLEAARLLQESLAISSVSLGTSFSATLDWATDPASDDSLVGALSHVFQYEGGSRVGTYPVTPAGTTLHVTGITQFSQWYAGNEPPSNVPEWQDLDPW